MLSRPHLASARPKCNSILHLFGKWLFEAAFTGSRFSLRQYGGGAGGGTHSKNEADNGRRPNSLLLESSSQQAQQQHRKLGPSSSSASSTSVVGVVVGGGGAPDSLDIPAALTPERFESGRAEALGALCRIFCAKKTGEEILPVYAARFYLAVQQGLVVAPDKIVSEVLSLILVNSVDLLRLDLEGVDVLLPYLVTALEAVLAERELRLRPSNVHKSELRRAGIHLLLSMIALPLHFKTLPIREIVPGASESSSITFLSLRLRIVNLLIIALQVEADPLNTQMLLGGLMLCVQDASLLEQMESGQHFHMEEGTQGQVISAATSDAYSSISDNTYNEDQSSSEHSYIDPSGDSAHAVFVRATYLVCHRLISSWKSDLNTSLAAIELLAGLARLKIHEQDPLECKRAVKWLCDYIVTQCSRPPPAHSKDLHSSIVAAFNCCKTWLLKHAYLLQDKECIATVLEVVELGISGSKSQNRASDTPIYKEQKVLNPASRRVLDAAEGLLATILEQVGHFPSACGAESLSTLLDEVSLLDHCNAFPSDVCGGEAGFAAAPSSSPLAEAVQNFRYFVVDSQLILAILEEPLGNDPDPQPTVTVLLRSATGRTAWTLQLRHLPRHKSAAGQKAAQANPGRPLPMGDAGLRPDVKPRFFPDAIDRIPLCKADKSIPAVESVAGDERASMELDALSRLMEQQAALEEEIVLRLSHEGESLLRAVGNGNGGGGGGGGYAGQQQALEADCRAPEPCQEFQTARLVLSHLGLLDLSALRGAGLEQGGGAVGAGLPPRLVALETDSPGFVTDLEEVDQLSSRTADTVYIYYIRSGQKNARDILQNVTTSSLVHAHFLEFLSTLGWPVNVWRHAGWTGHVSTSWRMQTEPMLPRNAPQHGGAMFNGDNYVLYWSDAAAETAFVVPSSAAAAATGHWSNAAAGAEGAKDAAAGGDSGPGSLERVDGKPLAPPSLTLDLEPSASGGVPGSDGNLFHQQPKRKVSRAVSAAVTPDIKLAVIWTESLEDVVTAPVETLLAQTSTGLESHCGGIPGRTVSNGVDAFVIFIHPLRNGLLRIKLQGQITKMNLATPLVDGMVVSRRSVGALVRQTAVNMAMRRRLELDSFQPPHVRRKLKIADMVRKYRSHMTEPEFYAHLFSHPTSL